ncbi:hypothetical protein K432DRAFT_400631 [Lepidopterella palustris CBS 459.81]|uniref:BTB domain-containing protein n=1 Tax=Lepidopterella palustris CBS 459.81 TaxID=1314670 RepID=A0A8E2EK52_9PEZI|nr:hypothetical protein K432DRAFT_400631 [Lepidopterella palustris CBS 459.81]
MVRSQEAALVPNVNGQLERSSWKAEAIRRGELKISGPIPLTEEEENELAKRNTDPLPQPSGLSSTQQSLKHTRSVNAGNHHVDKGKTKAEELQESPPRLRHKRSSTGIREMSELQRHTSPDLPISYSSPSPFESPSDNMVPKKRRKSGLRNVFRKMFGRRSKDAIKRDSAQRHGYHRSDPGVLTSVPEKPGEKAGSSSFSPADKRISNIPVRELELLNPLGSHLPFPMNVNAPQELSPPHDYLTFDSPPMIQRRRATLPSIVLSGAEVAALSAVWSGSGARVLSWEEQGQANIPSPEIGVALSSPTHKRRSRSAGALRDLSKNHDEIPRRRSAEIRYWRTSGMDRSASVYSTHTPLPQSEENVPGEIRDEPEAVTVGFLDEPGAIPTVDLVDSKMTDDAVHSPQPIQALYFGALTNEFSELHENAVEADVEASLPLEERVKRLENGMQALESSLHRLTGRSHRQTIILENAPKGRRSRQRSSSTVRDDHSRQSSKSSSHTEPLTEQGQGLPGPGPPSPLLPPTFLKSPSSAGSHTGQMSSFPHLAKTPSPHPRSSANLALPQASAPASQSASPQPPAISNQPDPAEQFAAVYTILRHERAARKALEKQVIALQQEVQDLRMIAHKLAHATAYPTPSPDAILSSAEELCTPRAYRGPERGPGFESEEEGGREGLRGRAKERITSRFSKSDSEGGDNEDTLEDEDEEGEGEGGKGMADKEGALQIATIRVGLRGNPDSEDVFTHKHVLSSTSEFFVAALRNVRGEATLPVVDLRVVDLPAIKAAYVHDLRSMALYGKGLQQAPSQIKREQERGQ